MKYTKKQLKEINKKHDEKVDLKNPGNRLDKEISKNWGLVASAIIIHKYLEG